MKHIILKSIKFYQNFFSFQFGKICRFHPSCSQYAYLAVKKYGPLKGSFLGITRIIRCNPWNPGGIDNP
ncbi:membrane protein insertion efficiency factor YidD [Patescibacteria group bacterium]